MQPLEPVINYLVDPNSGLKQVITEFLNAVMLFEAYLQSGALPYERSPQRKAHRNGTRSRTLKTHVGELKEYVRFLLGGVYYSLFSVMAVFSSTSLLIILQALPDDYIP